MFILNLACQDKPGIVASVATCLHKNDLNIEESAQFHDDASGKFFMRVVFSGNKEGFDEEFKDIASNFDMDWQIFEVNKPVKTLILVSKEDHCLNDLLYRWRTDHLNIDITGVVSNHLEAKELVETRGLDFYHLPITPDTKADQESQIEKLIEEEGVELILLARYMQILTPEFCQKYLGRMINIHHSFLPGFKGAKPYTQAYDRGVKMVGATAHFVTPDLDEGPIINQEVVPVTHSDDPERLKRKGRDIECLVLARATELFSERRIFLNDQRTVIL